MGNDSGNDDRKNNGSSSHDDDNDRLNWLKERGVEISTAEERAKKANESNTGVAPIFEQLSKLSVNDEDDDDNDGEGIKFVLIPHDDSKPIRTVKMPSTFSKDHMGDVIPTFVKPYFADKRSVDASLLHKQATKHFAAGSIKDVDGSDCVDMGNISVSAMNAVAAEGSVETFPLVHPATTNGYTGVYIYLDEIGLLKKLPVNKRAAAIGGACGYNPAPIFSGDIFVGRTRTKPKMVNVDFVAGLDTAGNAEWMRRAVSENLAWQQGLNEATGRSSQQQIQPAHAGTDGSVAEESNFSWTQDDEEIELTVPITVGIEAGSTVNKKDVKVTYKPRVVIVSHKGGEIVRVSLYESVDVDGCTWTLNNDKNQLIITCEKADSGKIWPSIGS